MRRRFLFHSRLVATTETSNYDLTRADVPVGRVTERLSIPCSPVRVCSESETSAANQLQYRPEATTNLWTDIGRPRKRGHRFYGAVWSGPSLSPSDPIGLSDRHERKAFRKMLWQTGGLA